MIRVVHPGFRIRMLTFYPSRIPDPGVKKAPDPGSGSATLGGSIAISLEVRRDPDGLKLTCLSCSQHCCSFLVSSAISATRAERSWQDSQEQDPPPCPPSSPPPCPSYSSPSPPSLSSPRQVENFFIKEYRVP